MSMKRAATEQHSAQNSTILQRASQGAKRPPRHTHGKVQVNSAAINFLNRTEKRDERSSNSMADCKQQLGSPEQQKKQRFVQKDNVAPSSG